MSSSEYRKGWVERTLIPTLSAASMGVLGANQNTVFGHICLAEVEIEQGVT
jgi:hypothetical protein